VCYNETKPRSQTCCTDGGPTWFVHPQTGEVKDGKLANTDATPMYWPVELGLKELLSSRLLTLSSTATLVSPTESSAMTDTMAMTTTFPASSRVQDDFAVSATSTSDAPSPTATSTFEGTPPGLSAGVSAGIGVGCGLLVVGIVGMGWLCRRSRKKRQLSRPQSDFQSQWSAKPFVYRHEAPHHELDPGRPRQELESPQSKERHDH
jgi:hypothetical protein